MNKVVCKLEYILNVFKSLIIFTKYVDIVLYIILGNKLQNIYAYFQIVF